MTDLPALMILDGDDNPNIPETQLSGGGLQRLRWRRYEIESYLFHPEALRRFIRQTVGEAQAVTHIEDFDRLSLDEIFHPRPSLRSPGESARC